jgi:hypothetical protein
MPAWLHLSSEEESTFLRKFDNRLPDLTVLRPGELVTATRSLPVPFGNNTRIFLIPFYLQAVHVHLGARGSVVVKALC